MYRMDQATKNLRLTILKKCKNKSAGHRVPYIKVLGPIVILVAKSHKTALLSNTAQ